MKDNYLKYLDLKNKENVNETPIFSIFIAANSLMMAYRFYKEFITKASRECKSYVGRDKSLCIAKFELDGLKTKKHHLEIGLKDCEKAKDQKRCERKIQKELDKTNNEINKKQKQFDMLYDLVKKEEKDSKKKRGK